MRPAGTDLARGTRTTVGGPRADTATTAETAEHHHTIPIP